MSEEPSGEKSEEPTPKRIEDALAKGQTPTSREPAVLASLAVLSGWLIYAADDLVGAGGVQLADLWREAGTLRYTAADLSRLSAAVLAPLAWGLAPLLAALMLAGLMAGVLQSKPRFVIERIRPKGSHLSLAKGWSRIFGKRGLVEFAKSLVKILAAGTVVIVVLRTALPTLADFMIRPPALFLDVTGGLVARFVLAVTGLMALVAAADVLWSRHVWREQLRMTRKEVSDETKQSEGDPILKARRRSLARDRSRRRMMEAVPGATLVLANPTHVAVALRYRHEEDAAPVVVAKGGDLLCLRIREIAEANGVPVFERIELARALYKVAEVDRPIPDAFYRAVAELINVVMRAGTRV